MKLIGLTSLALILILLVACAEKANPSPASSPTTPRNTPVTSTNPIATGTPTPTPVVVLGASFLEVVAPQNESVVSASSVTVQGRTAADAVVSVNGQAVDVDASGNFKVTISLDQGPNAIEIIASDFHGKQESRVISVIRIS